MKHKKLLKQSYMGLYALRCTLSIIVLLGTIVFFSGGSIYAQKRPFDYKGDTKAVSGEIQLTLKSGPYKIESTKYKVLKKVQSGKFIKMKGFTTTTSPGDPILPFRIYDVAVPPNIDWNSVKLKFETEIVELPGDHIIPPVPPLRARVGDEEFVWWGEGKDIIDGRNVNIYAKKAFYPKEPVKILSRVQMRKWKFIRLRYTPFQFNPVAKKLRLIKSVQVQFKFKRIGTKVFRTDPILDDTLMDDVAKKRFINFKKAQEWYRYVPAPKSQDFLVDPDYVIITTNAIRDNSTKLADFVAHKITLGHTVQVVTEDDYGILTGQPPNGTAEKIREWLINHYIASGIKYVLLIGNPDPDDPASSTDTVGDVPMKMCWPNLSYYTWFESPTDYFYANLTGNWDLDGDGFFGEYTSISDPTSPDPVVGQDTFSVRWTGRIQADVAGNYMFATSSDDGIRVTIDGTSVIDDWTPHYPNTTFGSITLDVGQHDIIVEYFENTGDAKASLWWRPPGVTYVSPVPKEKLYHLVGASYVPNGLDGQYFNNSDFTAPALTRVDERIYFFWGTGDRGPGGVDFTPDVYVGRIPVYSADYTTLDAILQKIIDYEIAAAPPWRQKFLTANVYLWEPASDYQLGEALKSDFADPLGFTTYRVYESDFGIIPPPECPVINPIDSSPTAPCNMLGELVNGGGCGLVNWSTHGSSTSASHLIASSDCSSLPDSTPAFTFQGSCLNGYPENSSNLGYSLLKNGAIATVSASRVSWNSCFNPPWDPNPDSGTNANLTYHYSEKIMKDSSAGHALYITKANVIPDSSWMNKMDYNIYGDPAVSLLRLYGGVVLLFDTSGSMSWRHDGTWGVPIDEQRLTLAKRAAYPFMELLYDHTNKRINFGIADFPPQPWSSTVGCNGQVITPMTLVTESSKNNAVTTTIPGLTADGNTPLLAGIDTARTMFGTEDNRAIILLSDGYHNCPNTVSVTDSEVTSRVSQLNADSVKVYTIGFGRPTDIDHPLLEKFANDSGGQFYDVTTPGFDPATWDPATELQATYKAILVDTLGLQTAVDPTGVIKAGKKVVREVKVNKHDWKISVYLSWVTAHRRRLGLTVKTSDGMNISPGATGVQFHQGSTYNILTVNLAYLQLPGKVGNTPWKIEINPIGLKPGEQENYQYSVIVNSGLKMKTAFDKKSYGTGDPITITAKITDLGHPVTGLTDVYVKIIRPEDGGGNWYSINKVSEAELKKIPEKFGHEKLSPLHRKAIFLTDFRKVSFPKWMDPSTIRLYDDGTHGDISAGDAIYTNRFTDTVKEGTYSFYFRASGATAEGNVFDRDYMVQKYISVNVDSNNILVEVIGPRLIENLAQYYIVITPKDALGNYLGPRYSGFIKMKANVGEFGSSLKDNLDGTYVRIFQVSKAVNLSDVNVIVEVKGETLSFNLGDILLKKKYSLSFHAGKTFPTGNFGSDYNSSYMFGLNVDYHFTSQFSLVGLLGYNHFKASSTLWDDTHWWNLSTNLKYELTTHPLRPYVNVGPGLYKPKGGSIKPGLNVGLGMDYSLNPYWILELGGDYHHVFTRGSSTRFFVTHVGLIYRF